MPRRSSPWRTARSSSRSRLPHGPISGFRKTCYAGSGPSRNDNGSRLRHWLKTKREADMPDAGDIVAKRITDVAADCGISLVATLPDGWITRLIATFAGDARFRHVAVNREESAIGLC